MSKFDRSLAVPIIGGEEERMLPTWSFLLECLEHTESRFTPALAIHSTPHTPHRYTHTAAAHTSWHTHNTDHLFLHIHTHVQEFWPSSDLIVYLVLKKVPLVPYPTPVVLLELLILLNWKKALIILWIMARNFIAWTFYELCSNCLKMPTSAN